VCPPIQQYVTKLVVTDLMSHRRRRDWNDDEKRGYRWIRQVNRLSAR
jgi:hypothetical protein